MPHRKLNVPEWGMMEAYQKALADRGYVADVSQMAAAVRLQRLYTELLAFKEKRGNAINRILNRHAPPRGVYFWGGVGRGKSFLMDCFFESLPYRRKKRIHFHAFMQRIHTELTALNVKTDPMSFVADKIAKEVRVLCFDEFHVSDIADAMILGRLLTLFDARGIVLIVTSNYPPDELYPDGLHRERFLPAIDLLKQRMDIIEVEANKDYRLQTLTQEEMYYCPADEAAESGMRRAFLMALQEEGGAQEMGGSIEILGRKIPIQGKGRQLIWFDFESLCGGARSQNDYLEIARNYSTILLSRIPRLSGRHADAARRLTWLIDILYDHRVKLIVSAECKAEELYAKGAYAHEFARTVSRLIEMRSREYWMRPHLH